MILFVGLSSFRFDRLESSTLFLSVSSVFLPSKRYVIPSLQYEAELWVSDLLLYLLLSSFFFTNGKFQSLYPACAVTPPTNTASLSGISPSPAFVPILSYPTPAAISFPPRLHIPALQNQRPCCTLLSRVILPLHCCRISLSVQCLLGCYSPSPNCSPLASTRI